MSGRAVEAAGDVDTLLLDKTGTITLGNRQATEFVPAPGVTEQELADAAQLASLADETPEGRSIVVLAKEKYGLRGRELSPLRGHVHSLHRADAHVRRGPRRPRHPQRRRGRHQEIRDEMAASRACGSGGSRRSASRIPAARRCWSPKNHKMLGDDPLEGHRQGRHARALRSAARDGHPHRDDHRR